MFNHPTEWSALDRDDPTPLSSNHLLYFFFLVIDGFHYLRKRQVHRAFLHIWYLTSYPHHRSFNLKNTLHLLPVSTTVISSSLLKSPFIFINTQPWSQRRWRHYTEVLLLILPALLISPVGIISFYLFIEPHIISIHRSLSLSLVILH